MSDVGDVFREDSMDYNEDDDLYASYDAFKALLNAGLTRREALERTGLDEETLQMLEQEEDVIDFKNDAKEVWDDEENRAFDEKFMSSDDMTDEDDDVFGGNSQFDEADDYGSSGGGGGWDGGGVHRGKNCCCGSDGPPPCRVRRNGSDQLRMGRIPLERPHQIVADPAAVEAAGLGPHPLAIQPAAIHGCRVEGEPARERRVGRRGAGVLPDHPFERAAVGGHHIEVAGHPFPFAEAATPGWPQQPRIERLRRQVDGGGVEGFQHPQRVLAVGQRQAQRLHPHMAVAGHQSRRARVGSHPFAAIGLQPGRPRGRDVHGVSRG